MRKGVLMFVLSIAEILKSNLFSAFYQCKRLVDMERSMHV